MALVLADFDMPEGSASGGLDELYLIKASDLTSIAPIDGTSKKIPANGIVKKTGKKFYRFDFLKNSEKVKAGTTTNDIGTPQAPAYETIVKVRIKGHDAAATDYLRNIRSLGRLVIAQVTQEGPIRIIGDVKAPAIMHKLTDMQGEDLEEFAGFECEFYHKSKNGPQHYDGDVDDLTTVGS
jgi:hypothetical protein